MTVYSINIADVVLLGFVTVTSLFLMVTRIMDHVRCNHVMEEAYGLNLIEADDIKGQRQDNNISLVVYIEVCLIAIMCQMFNMWVVPKFNFTSTVNSAIWVVCMIIQIIILTFLVIAGVKNLSDITEAEELIDNTYERRNKQMYARKRVRNKYVREDGTVCSEVVKLSDTVSAIKVAETPEYTEWVFENK